MQPRSCRLAREEGWAVGHRRVPWRRAAGLGIVAGMERMDRRQGPGVTPAADPAVTAEEAWMRAALAEARAALGHADVPVGAVVIGPDGAELGRGRNRREEAADPTAHAELLAMRAAARALGTWRLDGCTVAVTLEPCSMCAGALVQARVARLVFGADDPKAGAVTSLFDLVRDPRLPHRVEVRRGVLADECAEVLRAFFRARRGQG
jgi:tRNA(adenine34) deaminase